MENSEIFRMCVTARAAAANSAPLLRRRILRYPPPGREAPVLVPPLVALPDGCS